MPRARHLVLAVHCRSQSRRRAGRPQDPRRPRGPRTGGVRCARRSSARLARRGLTADRALTEPLGAHHPHVRRIRALLRDRRARDAEGLFVCEGPRVVEAALEHGAELVECVVAAEATAVAHAVAERAAKAGVPVRALAPGVAGRVADTVNTQGLFGVARLARMKVEGIARATLIVVAVRINDPGNAGTLVRSAAGAGADAVVLGAGSVDAYNPKVLRAPAGARFPVRVVEGVPQVESLGALGPA